LELAGAFMRVGRLVAPCNGGAASPEGAFEDKPYSVNQIVNEVGA
jgi:hypothetical protein